ncbi:FERM domain-containing protein 3-like [Homalodisca vitripennis]|uniref:FERM domain-containing protein 3-like n=1 Tax=Homalodisca vitripennis TaxID=197043 RepID=UPI001EEC27C3|nr:FERM domain-containing protein 3-like [Homalodisca vitripennis]
MFIIHLIYQEKKTTVGFKCPTGAACRHVWRCAIEQMLFFTLPSSADAPSVVTGGSFFSWSSSKFRYSGRVEKGRSWRILHYAETSRASHGAASDARPIVCLQPPPHPSPVTLATVVYQDPTIQQTRGWTRG